MVKFNPRQASQGLVFEFQFRRLAALVSDMEQIRQGASVEVLAGEAVPFSIAGDSGGVRPRARWDFRPEIPRSKEQAG